MYKWTSLFENSTAWLFRVFHFQFYLKLLLTRSTWYRNNKDYKISFVNVSAKLYRFLHVSALGETIFDFTFFSQLPHNYPGARHILANYLKLWIVTLWFYSEPLLCCKRGQRHMPHEKSCRGRLLESSHLTTLPENKHKEQTSSTTSEEAWPLSQAIEAAITRL